MSVALELFRRGQQRAAQAGLILVDTKYELGVDGRSDRLTLIDEVHTPDSSRYWEASTYEARLAAGEEPDSADKELVRRWYVDAGFDGRRRAAAAARRGRRGGLRPLRRRARAPHRPQPFQPAARAGGARASRHAVTAWLAAHRPPAIAERIGGDRA